LEIGFFMLLFVLQLDIVAFASLAQVYFIDKEVQYSLRDYMQESCPNLVGHVNRMKERYATHTSRLVIPCPVYLLRNGVFWDVTPCFSVKTDPSSG
jgi:predicted ATP-dependent Lon-type protease